MYQNNVEFETVYVMKSSQNIIPVDLSLCIRWNDLLWQLSYYDRVESWIKIKTLLCELSVQFGDSRHNLKVIYETSNDDFSRLGLHITHPYPARQLRFQNSSHIWPGGDLRASDIPQTGYNSRISLSGDAGQVSSHYLFSANSSHNVNSLCPGQLTAHNDTHDSRLTVHRYWASQAWLTLDS